MDGPLERPAVADGGLPVLEQTRQVLVDGGGVPALAVAAFLQQSGHDPVLVDRPDCRPLRPMTTLWPPGVRVLDAVGVGDAVRNAGRPVDAVSVRTGDDSGACQTLTADSDDSTPVAVDTSALADALANRVSAIPRLSTRLAATTGHDQALEVEFENGVREFFDLLVTTDAEAAPARATGADDRTDQTTLAGIEVLLDADQPLPALPTDCWLDGVAAQLLPPPSTDASGVLRVLAPEDVAAAGGVAERVAAAVPDMDDDATAAWTAAVEAAEWTPVPRMDVESAEWASGRVAYCGVAAFPAPRLTALQPALALEDAWVLADELANGHDTVGTSLAAYARRRSHRLETIFRRLSSGSASNAYPAARADLFETVSRLRAAVLGSLCAPGLAELQRNVPERL
jgi:2-polyprenyl-6-methoxyphenol hydroxylase-like FAD-dependent oxidoreductase